jgi:Ca-activated chloride channel family protein
VPVIVLLTDGEIGAESGLLALLQREGGQVRVFTVGIDTAVNSGLLKKLAQVGRGTATFVEPGAALEDALRAVAREIGQPLVTDLRAEEIDAGLVAGTGAPERMPDLFAGRAASASFRLQPRKPGAAAGSIRVSGKFGDGSKFEQVVQVREVPMSGLAHVWARARVSDLEDRYRLEPQSQPALQEEMIALSLRHTVLTRFTAFVVVDQAEIANPTGQRRDVVQPVETPAGWELQQAAPAMAPSAAAPAPMPGGQGLKHMLTLGGMGRNRAPVAQARAQGPADSKMKKESMPVSAVDKSAAYDDFEASDALFEEAVAGDLRGSGSGGAASPKQPPAPTPAPLSKAERKQLDKAVDALLKQLDHVRAELAAGRAPKSDKLEKARLELLQLVARAAMNGRLPALERYLRSTLYLFIDALGAGSPAAALQLFDRQKADLDAAVKEFESLGGKPRGHFWAASI